MAISTFDALERQKYMLEKVLASRGHDAEQAQRLAKQLEYEVRRKYMEGDLEDKFATEAYLKRKIMELAAQHEQEKIAARAAALQATLNAPHMQCTLSTAVNLWIVKFGDGWVPQQTTTGAADEMNWSALGRRLADANRMEEYEDYWRIVT